MNRRYYLPVFVLVAVIALAGQSIAAQKVTVTGEVIDSACFINMGAKGADHRDCAQMCADAGIPLALLDQETDQLIWLASSVSMTSPNADLKQHAGHIVRITGEYKERAGAKVLVIDSIEHVSS